MLVWLAGARAGGLFWYEDWYKAALVLGDTKMTVWAGHEFYERKAEEPQQFLLSKGLRTVPSSSRSAGEVSV